MLTLTDTLDWMIEIKKTHTRDIGVKNPGLYIELKDPKYYWDNYNMDMATALF